MAISAIRLERYRPNDGAYACARGKNHPRAIAWFGFTSFWGHLRHLVASAIATENIDSRQWMIPDRPSDLLAQAIGVLEGRGAKPADTLLGAMNGKDLWIDFVSDTGDDVTVSEAVARIVVGTYETTDPDDEGRMVTLPRGDMLLLGGDLAYPVATVREITRRLVDPWNRVLMAEAPEKPRVLFAVPGNHDWYDGLDGFARLCQAPCAFERTQEAATGDDALHPAPDENPVLAWAEAFARGDHVAKPGSMALAGYVPVQRASYFRLALAPGLELFGVDRQLRGVDPRQQAYFAEGAGSGREAEFRLVLMPDPARAWGERRPNGEATLASLGIDPSRAPSYVLAGDVHHFERSHDGPSIHVVAGGGGAFLQGARIAKKGAAYEREAEFPGPRASWALLRGLPSHVAAGRSGWVITSYFALFDAAALLETFHSGLDSAMTIAIALSITVAIGTALLVGWRRHRTSLVFPFAIVLGLAVGALPIALGVAADELFMRRLSFLPYVGALGFLVAWPIATYASGFFFGVMLAMIARLGLNHAQPFAALGIPGFKHFMRMRIRTVDGAPEIDTWVIGVVDPVGKSPPLIVDAFRWPAKKAAPP